MSDRFILHRLFGLQVRKGRDEDKDRFASALMTHDGQSASVAPRQAATGRATRPPRATGPRPPVCLFGLKASLARRAYHRNMSTKTASKILTITLLRYDMRQRRLNSVNNYMQLPLHLHQALLYSINNSAVHFMPLLHPPVSLSARGKSTLCRFTRIWQDRRAS